MNVTQLHTLVNQVTKEILGENVLVAEDLSNIVDIGAAIVDAEQVDNYVKKLVNHIGKVIFTDRLYAGGAPSVMIDAWEFGSILQKVTAELPEAEANDGWGLINGTDYTPNKFYQPTVTTKFFNSKVTFDIAMSFTEKQVKESFSNREQLNGFISMLTTAVENSMTVKLDALIMRTINNMVGHTLYASLWDIEAVAMDYTGTDVKAVNLLKLYNDTVSVDNALTVDTALSNPDFIRFATYTIAMYSDRMAKISTLFNVEGKERFTPKDKQRIVLLSDFSKASDTFLASNTFNADKVALPSHDSIPYWQGSGLSYSLSDTSKIMVKVKDGDETATIETSGVLGVMFDRDALGVCNTDRRVTTNYNPKAEFYTNFYKFDASYFNDLSENFVVFFMGAQEVVENEGVQE